MISGFRKIRREWATVNAEEAGKAVLVKVIGLMKRAGMSLEDWFRFMDASQVRFVFVVRDPALSPLAQEKAFTVLGQFVWNISWRISYRCRGFCSES